MRGVFNALTFSLTSYIRVGSGAGSDPAPYLRGSLPSHGKHWPETGESYHGAPSHPGGPYHGNPSVLITRGNVQEISNENDTITTALLADVSLFQNVTGLGSTTPPHSGQRGHSGIQTGNSSDRSLSSGPVRSVGKTDSEVSQVSLPTAATRYLQEDRTNGSPVSQSLVDRTAVKPEVIELTTVSVNHIYMHHFTFLRYIGVGAIALAMCGLIACMMPGAGGQRMTPPSYNPEHESSFSFEQYCRQVQLWTMMSDLQPYQQCAALLQQLRGSAA